jgi:hypothetical protein
MFARPNGKSRPSSGNAPGRKRRSQKDATDASQSSALPVPVGSEKRLEPPPVPVNKVAGIHRWVGSTVQTGKSGGYNGRVAALEEAVKRFKRKADKQEKRILDGLKRLEQVVGKAVDRIVRRARKDGVAVTGAVEQLRQEIARVTVASNGRPQATSRSEKRPTTKKKLEAPVVVPAKGPEVERKVDGHLGALQQAVGAVAEAVSRVVLRGQKDGAVIAAQREMGDRWKREAASVLKELRQLQAGMATVSDVQGRAEIRLEGTVKKKKLPPVPVVAAMPDSYKAENVYPSEETKVIVSPVKEASADQAEGSASSSLISKKWHVAAGHVNLPKFT